MSNELYKTLFFDSNANNYNLMKLSKSEGENGIIMIKKLHDQHRQ